MVPSAQTVTLSYTAKETQLLMQLLDIAVKAGGIAVAGEAATLYHKHMAAVQAAVAVSTSDAEPVAKPKPPKKDKVQ